MTLQLRVAREKELKSIHEMQVQSFGPLLTKYQDLDTNPALETLDDVTERFHRSNGIFYVIQLDETDIGVICLLEIKPNHIRISPMFLKPTFQKRGHAKRAIRLLEKAYPDAIIWELQTIKEEPALVQFYEKMGYRTTGVEKTINEKMTLIAYRKSILSEGRHA